MESNEDYGTAIPIKYEPQCVEEQVYYCYGNNSIDDKIKNYKILIVNHNYTQFVDIKSDISSVICVSDASVINNVEWLVINDCNIKELYNFDSGKIFASLIGIDLSRNKICDLEAIQIIDPKVSPKLFYVDFTDNPLSYKEKNKLVIDILEVNPSLAVINKHIVTPYDLYKVFLKTTADKKAEIGKLQLKCALRNMCFFDSRKMMREFYLKIFTDKIEILDLSGLNLVYFDFNLFPEAKFIDLSNNKLGDKELFIFPKNERTLKKLCYLDMSGNNFKTNDLDELKERIPNECAFLNDYTQNKTNVNNDQINDHINVHSPQSTNGSEQPGGQSQQAEQIRPQELEIMLENFQLYFKKMEQHEYMIQIVYSPILQKNNNTIDEETSISVSSTFNSRSISNKIEHRSTEQPVKFINTDQKEKYPIRPRQVYTGLHRMKLFNLLKDQYAEVNADDVSEDSNDGEDSGIFGGPLTDNVTVEVRSYMGEFEFKPLVLEFDAYRKLKFFLISYLDLNECLEDTFKVISNNCYNLVVLYIRDNKVEDYSFLKKTVMIKLKNLDISSNSRSLNLENIKYLRNLPELHNLIIDDENFSFKDGSSKKGNHQNNNKRNRNKHDDESTEYSNVNSTNIKDDDIEDDDLEVDNTGNINYKDIIFKILRKLHYYNGYPNLMPPTPAQWFAMRAKPVEEDEEKRYFKNDNFIPYIPNLDYQNESLEERERSITRVPVGDKKWRNIFPVCTTDESSATEAEKSEEAKKVTFFSKFKSYAEMFFEQIPKFQLFWSYFMRGSFKSKNKISSLYFNLMFYCLLFENFCSQYNLRVFTRFTTLELIVLLPITTFVLFILLKSDFKPSRYRDIYEKRFYSWPIFALIVIPICGLFWLFGYLDYKFFDHTKNYFAYIFQVFMSLVLLGIGFSIFIHKFIESQRDSSIPNAFLEAKLFKSRIFFLTIVILEFPLCNFCVNLIREYNTPSTWFYSISFLSFLFMIYIKFCAEIHMSCSYITKKIENERSTFVNDKEKEYETVYHTYATQYRTSCLFLYDKYNARPRIARLRSIKALYISKYTEFIEFLNKVLLTICTDLLPLWISAWSASLLRLVISFVMLTFYLLFQPYFESKENVSQILASSGNVFIAFSDTISGDVKAILLFIGLFLNFMAFFVGLLKTEWFTRHGKKIGNAYSKI